MISDEIDAELMAKFVQQLHSADAVTVDDGPVLTSWITDIPVHPEDAAPGEPFLRFTWTDEEGLEYDVTIDTDAFLPNSNPQEVEEGLWKLVDSEGAPTEIRMFRLVQIGASVAV